MKPTFSFSPAAKGLAAAANSEVARKVLLAIASSNPWRNTSVEPPLSAALEGLVAVTVVGPESLELTGAVVGSGGTSVGLSLLQAANATMAISKNAPINIRWDCVKMGICRIRLYKLIPPKFLNYSANPCVNDA